jgi:hypothetical protein
VLQRFLKPALLAATIAIPVVAGALYLEVGDPAGNPEAKSLKAVLVVRTTACKSPEKTTIRGVAEGLIDGAQRSIPLTLASMSKPGVFGVRQEWPANGNWVIKLVATNPDYGNYSTSVLVPFDKGSLQLSKAKHLFREPTSADVAEMLGPTAAVRSSLH